jgi:acyl carrier protein
MLPELTVQRSTVEQAVYELITDKLGVDRHRLVPTADLRNDLGADSLDIVELIVMLGQRFPLCPSHRQHGDGDSVEDLRTVSHLLALVDRSALSA